MLSRINIYIFVLYCFDCVNKFSKREKDAGFIYQKREFYSDCVKFDAQCDSGVTYKEQVVDTWVNIGLITYKPT